MKRGKQKLLRTENIIFSATMYPLSTDVAKAFREEKKEDVGAVRITANELTKPPVRTVSAAHKEEL